MALVRVFLKSLLLSEIWTLQHLQDRAESPEILPKGFQRDIYLKFSVEKSLRNTNVYLRHKYMSLLQSEQTVLVARNDSIF